MSMNYGKELPKDKRDGQYDGAPPSTPSLQSQSGVPIVSSVITLTNNTTVMEISAISGTAGSGGLILKWGTSSVTGTNFDSFVQAGLTRIFVVPVSVMGMSASVQGANPANGLYNAVAIKTATTQSSSVFTTEY